MPYDRVPSNVANPDLFFADPDPYIRYPVLATGTSISNLCGSRYHVFVVAVKQVIKFNNVYQTAFY